MGYVLLQVAFVDLLRRLRYLYPVYLRWRLTAGGCSVQTGNLYPTCNECKVEFEGAANFFHFKELLPLDGPTLRVALNSKGRVVEGLATCNLQGGRSQATNRLP